jgi:hypothetical protein
MKSNEENQGIQIQNSVPAHESKLINTTSESVVLKTNSGNLTLPASENPIKLKWKKDSLPYEPLSTWDISVTIVVKSYVEIREFPASGDIIVSDDVVRHMYQRGIVYCLGRVFTVENGELTEHPRVSNRWADQMPCLYC